MFSNHPKPPFFIVAVVVFLFAHAPLFAAQNTDKVLHHALIIQPNLNNGQLTVRDTLSLPKQATATVFSVQLSDQFRVQYANKPLTASSTQAGISTYQIPLIPEQQTVTLEYTGTITSTPQCQFTQQVCALLNNDGIYLSPALAWYPTTDSDLHTFSMSIEALPSTWRSLSQGLEKTPNHWQITKPQDGIYLIAGKFNVYEKKGAIATAQVYLRHDDPALAQQYLATTDYYLNYYQQQLGAYPYAKFATVESFWESGWGMPSFTLLGSRVMRMPFILHTSFPHEILHNWWGNSVYVDASSGNWSEGLTAYLADHGLKEKSGKDSAYRRTALNKYAVFTQGGNDVPITQFRSRHNNATQAIGYSKLLMVYHMLRRQLGDKLFFSGLQQFYRQYQYQYASMNDLIASLSASSQQDLKPFFKQWISQTDAPQLQIKPSQKNADHSVSLTLEQYSSQAPFHLAIPVVAFAKEKVIWQQTVTLNQQEKTFHLTPPKQADRLAIDPFFDVLRKPLAEEIPPNLHAFTDPQPKAIHAVTKPLWWSDIANDLVKANPKTMHLATADDKATTIIKLGMAAQQSGKYSTLTITNTHYQLGEQRFERHLHSLVFVEQQPQQTIISLDSPSAAQATTVLRKLRHYGKYSYLVFDQQGKNVAKGQWTVRRSPLSIDLRND